MITFQTNIWENDWRVILRGNYLKEIISRCNTAFTSREIIVNNVNNRKKIAKLLDQKIAEGIIDKYYFVDDYIEEVLQHFKLTKESFTGAYYVSSSELVGIYLCKTQFLLYFKGDSHLYKNGGSWIQEGINLLNNNDNVLVVNPIWNKRKNEVKQESDGMHGNFSISYGFSDQCFLVRTQDFQQPIYNEFHPDSQRYPWGYSFEAMVYSYMRNNNLKRATYIASSYRHKNFKLKVPYQDIAVIRSIYAKIRLLGY